jgi:outer membrane protein OmpA-like peptidoglycan-associated protein
MRLAGAALVVLFACGCYCQAIIVQPSGPASTATAAVAPPGHDIVALLGDPETRTVGRVIVSSMLGASVELQDKRTATRVVIGLPPSVVFRFSESQVQQLFGDALAALPPAPRHFLLYFANGSDQLTAASEKLLPAILVFVKNRAVPDVTVVGHTDTTGDAQANVEFGRRRATTIRDRLVGAGLDAGIVSIASHGEADLLVRTPDNTPEPKNRRVDVSVR